MSPIHIILTHYVNMSAGYNLVGLIDGVECLMHRISKVLYFNNDGNLVSDFLTRELSLGSLGAANFHIPKQDKSGTGANFLVEWRSDAPASEPLIESVMLDCETHKGMSFLSKGKVIREIR